MCRAGEHCAACLVPSPAGSCSSVPAAAVALACFGALPVGAAADPAALSPARAATYAALLDALNADPAYSLGRRDQLVAGFAERYAGPTSTLRAVRRRGARRDRRAASQRFAHAAHDELASWDGALKPDALSLAALAFEPPEDTHTIVFTV